MLPVTQWLTLALATLSYGSAIWGGLRFFRVNDAGAARGKRRIAALVVPFTVLGLWLIWQRPAASPWLAALSAGVYLLSLIVFWWAIHANRRQPLAFAGSQQQPQKLMLAGPYAWVRHPFYSAYLAGWLALWLAVPCLLTTAMLLIMVNVYTRLAQQEEALIQQSPLAAVYRMYMLQTARFVPWLM